MTTYTGTGTLQSPKTQFVVTIVLVFLVGTVVGALVMNLGAHKGLHRAAFWSDTGREISLQHYLGYLGNLPPGHASGPDARGVRSHHRRAQRRGGAI